MSRASHRLRLAPTVLAVCTAIAAGCGRPPDRREARDFERMRQQQRYDAYERSPFFANGEVMQTPPAHTVSRDARGDGASPWANNHADGATTEAYLTGATSAGPVADFPEPVDQRTLALGAQQFAISCRPCHGDGGFGGGPVAANLEKHPANLRSPQVVARAPGFVFNVITTGVGAMPPYGWQLTPAQRWAVVAYVKSLATAPMTAAARRDSAAAAYLVQVDSARAAGANLHVLSQFAERAP